MNISFSKLDPNNLINGTCLSPRKAEDLGAIVKGFLHFNGIEVGEWIEDFLLGYSPSSHTYTLIVYKGRSEIATIEEISKLLIKAGIKFEKSIGANKLVYSPDRSKGYTVVGFTFTIEAS